MKYFVTFKNWERSERFCSRLLRMYCSPPQCEHFTSLESTLDGFPFYGFRGHLERQHKTLFVLFFFFFLCLCFEFIYQTEKLDVEPENKDCCFELTPKLSMNSLKFFVHGTQTMRKKLGNKFGKQLDPSSHPIGSDRPI